MSWYSIAAALMLRAGASAEAPSISICSEPTRDEQDAVAELGRWARSARLRVKDCGPNEAPPWLAFVERAGEVVLRYRSSLGARERAVPWLDRADSPLSRLRAGGALARVAVLLEALLAEDSLERPTEPVATPTFVEGRRGSASPSRGAAAGPSPAEPSPRPPPRPPPVLPPIDLAAIDPPVEAVPSRAPELSAPAEGAPSPEGEPPAQPASRLPFAVEGFAGWRVRSPGLSVLEVGGGLRWGLISLAGFYQPPVEWSLDGRPLELVSGGAALGVHLTLWQMTRWRAGLLGHLVVEYLALRRKDLEGAQTHGLWDLGASAGLFGSVGIGPLRVEARLEGLALPTGREVVIPGGPQASLNRFGLRLGAGLSWEAPAR